MQYCSFPPEGVTGTSGYRFEYNLHLIKIPSHLNRESIYRWKMSMYTLVNSGEALTERIHTLLLLFFIWKYWVALQRQMRPTIPRLDLNLKIFRVGVGISHLMIPGLPPKPAGVITAAAVNWVCCYDCYGAWNTRQWGTSLCLWSGWFLTLTQHRKEREAHQHTKQLHHELEEELEKLKSSEFSVGNSSTCCIIYHMNRC